MFERLVPCHRVGAVEAAVEFPSHFTRSATSILADKNLFPRRGGLLGRTSRRKVARSLRGSSRYKKHSLGTELAKKVRDEAGRKVAADHRNKKRHRCNDRELFLTRHLMIQRPSFRAPAWISTTDHLCVYVTEQRIFLVMCVWKCGLARRFIGNDNQTLWCKNYIDIDKVKRVWKFRLTCRNWLILMLWTFWLYI